ncbi:hypothetical protein OAW27_00225 [bacterium]|nr:hypothetical protein [bacterium]
MTQTSLGLSDKEFLEKDPAEFLDAVEEETVENPVVEEETNTSDQTDDDSDIASTEEVSEAQEQTEVEPIQDQVSQPFGDTQTELKTSTDSKTTDSLDTSKKDSTDTAGDTQETIEPNYKSAYEKVTAPFKANGVDMQVKNPDDIVRLMQMGANYQKKMSQLKPNLKLIKMLENNQLLDEAKLNNLIDLSKKDPLAITKLIKESTVDPLDIDKEAPVDYQPNNYSITDKEYNLDKVLDDIKGSETFDRTINVLTKEWDIESRSTISDYPDIIAVINDHMANGVFDQVNARLQQEKTLGKLAGTPDVEAYRQIAEDMHKNNLFKHSQSQSTESSQVSSNSEPKQADVDRDKKRKAAAPVKQTASNKAPADPEFLGLSDDEFMKKYATP